MMNEWLDEDGYPTESCLEKIKNWPVGDSEEDLIEFIKSVWWATDWGWSESVINHPYRKNRKVKEYQISTGGWSGNESLMKAFEENIIWHFVWQSSRRGGHYVFHIDLPDNNGEYDT